MKDSENRLGVCKLEIAPPGPCLQTICFLELPPLALGVFAITSWFIEEWVPTSKNYARTRSSRASHVHFYSSTVSTIALFLDYGISWKGYTLIIDVEALLYTIRRGIRNVPWVDWGPSSTHLFERTPQCPAGPSWIMELSPLVLRQYYPRRTQYTQSMPENTSSSHRAVPQVSSSTEVFGKLWDEHRIETNLPYRDVVVNDLNIGPVQQILADREWVVRVAGTEVREFCAHAQTVPV